MKSNLKINDIIQDLWILEESGLDIFSRVNKSKIEEQLFGGVMTALNFLSIGLVSSDLTSFECSGTHYTILKSNYNAKKYLFVCNSSNNIEAIKTMERLTQIKDKFFEIYGQKLNEWDGDLEKFSVCNNKFEKMIEETARNLYPSETFKSFWKS
ncbi:MAG TPA: hypothetical protein VGB37_08155 [Candidatus Lokiarchaeia archaeon]